MLLLITAIAVMGFIAAFDLIYQRYKWTEEHKMTKSEVKDERRQADGTAADVGVRASNLDDIGRVVGL